MAENRVLRSFSRALGLGLPSGFPPGARRLTFPDAASAARVLGRFTEPHDRSVLRLLLEESCGWTGQHLLSDEQVLELVARLLAAGRLVACEPPDASVAALAVSDEPYPVRDLGAHWSGPVGERPATPEAAGPAGPGAGAPPPRPAETTWIGIELVAEDGRPVAGYRYWLMLPDGSERTGRLDAEGRARVEGIPAGTCLVRFPDLAG